MKTTYEYLAKASDGCLKQAKACGDKDHAGRAALWKYNLYLVSLQFDAIRESGGAKAEGPMSDSEWDEAVLTEAQKQKLSEVKTL